MTRTETLWSAHEIVRLKSAIAERRREEMTETEIRPLLDALDHHDGTFHAAVGPGVTAEDYWAQNKPDLKNLLGRDPSQRQKSDPAGEGRPPQPAG